MEHCKGIELSIQTHRLSVSRRCKVIDTLRDVIDTATVA